MVMAWSPSWPSGSEKVWVSWSCEAKDHRSARASMASWDVG